MILNNNAGILVMLHVPAVGRGPASYSAHPQSRQKLVNDGVLLKRHARYVLILDTQGKVRMHENHPFTSDHSVIPLIAVLGPARIQNEILPEVCLLEIGCQRSRPYRRVHTGRNQVLLLGRHAARDLALHEIGSVSEALQACIQEIVLDAWHRWGCPRPWALKDGRAPLERGVQFTVHRQDAWLHELLLREHVRYMEFVMLKFSRFAAKRLRNSHLVSTDRNAYGPRATEVAHDLLASSYVKNPLLREALLRNMGSKRLLVEGLLIAFGGLVHEPDDEMRLVYGEGASTLPFRQHLFVYRTPDQPGDGRGRHAKGCARFEVLLDRRWRTRHLAEQETPQETPSEQKEGRYYDDVPF